MISIYSKKTEIELSQRRLEALEKYNKIIQYGRQNPVWFIENIFRIQLLDFQKVIIMNSWCAESVVWLASRNSGKTFLGAVYMMTRALLFPYYKINLLNVSARQSQDTFIKMEDIAKKRIASLVNTSDVFVNEVSRNQAAGDGFLHSEQTYYCQLYNGSNITSLVSTPKTIVGRRSNLNIYDEAGKIPEELFNLTVPFVTQDTNFRTGMNVDLSALPRDLPNQCIYMSSAEDVSSYLYRMYKECAKSMMMGFTDKYAIDINCEIPMHPTLHGKKYAPLLKKSVVDAAMRMNEQKALREYYNLFDTSGGVDAAVTRDVITRNERVYVPVLGNEGKEGVHYGIFYDPAMQQDNSFILIGEFWRDEKRGWMARVINGINLIERLPSGKKKPMISTDQIRRLRQEILKYNGDAPDYDNLFIFVDPGSGGGGRLISDDLLEDWFDEHGNLHRGLIDMEDEAYKDKAFKFPNAIRGVLRLWNSQKYKATMFGEATELMRQNLIIFPCPLPGSGKLELDDGREVVLTDDEFRALVEMDVMKEEIVAIKKMKTPAGNIKFELAPDKATGAHAMNDDRASARRIGHVKPFLIDLEAQRWVTGRKFKYSVNDLAKGA